MVSRVDPKPTYYFNTFFKSIRPYVISLRTSLIRSIFSKVVTIKALPEKYWESPEIVNDLEHGLFSVENIYDEIADECIRSTDPYSEVAIFANSIAKSFKGKNAARYDVNLCAAICKAHDKLYHDVSTIYHGTEAAVALVDQILNTDVIKTEADSRNLFWANATGKFINILQANACFQNTDAINILNDEHVNVMSRVTSVAFSWFANTEKVLYRSGNRHNYLAHLFHSGKRVNAFEEAKDVLDDFEVTLSDLVGKHISVYKIGAITYLKKANTVFILSRDDIISVLKMMRAVSNVAVYFQVRNHKAKSTADMAVRVLQNFFRHLGMKITNRVPFGNTLRALNIANMMLFNAYGEDPNIDRIGYKDRDAQLKAEILSLDRDALNLLKSFTDLAYNDLDAINIAFMYHAVVGDDAGVDDLMAKLKDAPSKPIKKDKAYWNKFLSFFDTYNLVRYITTYRRIPNTAGAPIKDTDSWVAKCLSGKFKMPPYDLYGTTWIEGEFEWRDHAAFWHLNAQDVTLVCNSPELYRAGGGVIPAEFSNELLFTLRHGDSLTTDKDIPASEYLVLYNKAIDHLRDHSTFIAAAKNEAAKPSAKKRVTFSADHTFRKMQAMIDKNIADFTCHIPGPILALDHRSAEKKFHAIAKNTLLDNYTLNASHDVKAWSESQSREEFMEFMHHTVRMGKGFSTAEIKHWWATITVMFNKMGTSLAVKMPSGGFQGMPGRQDSVEHAAELLFFIDEMRHSGIITKDTKTIHYTCIDDCVASLISKAVVDNPEKIYAELSEHYRKLGYELDKVKSIVSFIKAIFCSRRFISGLEIPSDFKTFIKHGVSYEAVFHYPNNVVHEYLSGCLGAVNANGEAFELYTASVTLGLAVMSLYAPDILTISPDRAAGYAMLCKEDMGWGIPDIVQWVTKDIIDTRTRSNFIFASAAEALLTGFTKSGITPGQCAVWAAAKSLEWATLPKILIFKNIFNAHKTGPADPVSAIRFMLLPHIRSYVTAEPWKSLMDHEVDDNINSLIDVLCTSSILDATIINALQNSFPWAFIDSLLGKCYASSVVSNAIPLKILNSCKRRVNAMGRARLIYLEKCVLQSDLTVTVEALGRLNVHDFSIAERNAFYTLNGMHVINHTFPDPIASFTQVTSNLKSSIQFSMANTRILGYTKLGYADVKTLASHKGIYVPPKSYNVLEYVNKRLLDWDPVTKCIITGLSVLAIARDEGHEVDGLTFLFTSTWDENAYVALDSPLLATARGSAKRLSANPGSVTHPIFINRNNSQHVEVNIASAIAALPEGGHMHDVLGSICAFRAAASLTVGLCLSLGVTAFHYYIGLRDTHVISRSNLRMKTNHLIPIITSCIDNSDRAWGFAQYHPSLKDRIAVVCQPHVTKNYLQAVTSENKRTYMENIVESARSKHLVAYPSEFKMREEIMSKSKEVASFAAALVIKKQGVGRSSHSDTYVAQVSNPIYKLLAGSVATVGDEYTLAMLIRSSLIQYINRLNDEDIFQLAVEGEEPKAEHIEMILEEKLWDRVIIAASSLFTTKLTPALWHNGFAKIGCHGFSTVGEVTVQTIKSFVGKNIRAIARSILPEYLRIVGNTAKSYQVAPQMLIIAPDADRVDNLNRVKAIKRAVKHHLKQLKARISALEKNTVTHWGDKRVYDVDPAARFIHLRVRKACFKAIVITDECEVDHAATCTAIANNLKRVQANIFKRHHITAKILSATCKTKSDIFQYMIAVSTHVNALTGGTGFNSVAGIESLNQCFEWFDLDTARERATLYAVTPGRYKPENTRIAVAEAPVLEDVRTFDAMNTLILTEDPDTVPKIIADSDWKSVAEAETFIGEHALSANPNILAKRLTKQKQLLTCLLNDMYTVRAIKQEVEGSADIDATNLVNLYKHVDAMNRSDEWIDLHFPGIDAEYAMCASPFEDSFLTVLDEMADETDPSAV